MPKKLPKIIIDYALNLYCELDASDFPMLKGRYTLREIAKLCQERVVKLGIKGFSIQHSTIQNLIKRNSNLWFHLRDEAWLKIMRKVDANDKYTQDLHKLHTYLRLRIEQIEIDLKFIKGFEKLLGR